MKTFTVNITNNKDFDFNYYNQTSSEVKVIKARYAGNKAMKVTATKNIKAFYRNIEVLVHEEVSNGYTLVSAVDGSFFHRHATTTEIEYR